MGGGHPKVSAVCVMPRDKSREKNARSRQSDLLSSAEHSRPCQVSACEVPHAPWAACCATPDCFFQTMEATSAECGVHAPASYCHALPAQSELRSQDGTRQFRVKVRHWELAKRMAADAHDAGGVGVLVVEEAGSVPRASCNALL